ncbi:MAG: hypothetical protein KA783_05875 [Chitinophagales bacterium]|nr:hypothetical protein [Chitinophagales bacterium]
MNTELIFLIQEAPEGGYTAQALGQSIFTEADTYAELKIQIADAVRCHFDEHELPSCFIILKMQLNYLKEQNILFKKHKPCLFL